MELPKAGAEYSYWTITSAEPLSSTPSVAFTRKGYEPDGGTDWYPAEWVDAPGKMRTLRVLIAGPECTPLPTGAIRLRTGSYATHVKISENPEVVIRPGDVDLIVK